VRFRSISLKETLGVRFFQFLEEVRGLTGRICSSTSEGFSGHLLDQLDLDLGIRLLKDLGSHFDVEGTETRSRSGRSIFNDVCKIRRMSVPAGPAKT